MDGYAQIVRFFIFDVDHVVAVCFSCRETTAPCLIANTRRGLPVTVWPILSFIDNHNFGFIIFYDDLYDCVTSRSWQRTCTANSRDYNYSPKVYSTMV